MSERKTERDSGRLTEAALAVMQKLNRSVVVKMELSQKEELSGY